MENIQVFLLAAKLMKINTGLLSPNTKYMILKLLTQRTMSKLISLSSKERQLMLELLKRDVRINTKIGWAVTMGVSVEQQNARNRVNMVNNLIKKLNTPNTFDGLPYTKEEWEESIRIKNAHLEFMKEIGNIEL